MRLRVLTLVPAIAMAATVSALTPSAHAETTPAQAAASPAVALSPAPAPPPAIAAPTVPVSPSPAAPVLGLPSAVAAAQATAPEAGTPLVFRPSKPLELAHEPSSSNVGWKLFAIALVLGGAALYARRKLSFKRAEDYQLTIVRRTTVGFRSELLVVNVEGQRLLLGVTPTSIQSLAILDGDGAPAPMAAATYADEPLASPSLSDRYAAAAPSLGDRFAAMLDAAEKPGGARAPKARAQVTPADKPATARRTKVAESKAKLAAPEAAGPLDEEPDVGSQARGLLALRGPR